MVLVVSYRGHRLSRGMVLDMPVAVRTTSWFGLPSVDEEGRVPGGDSGRVLVRRLLDLVDEPVLVDDRLDERVPLAGGGWAGPLRSVPVNDTVMVNMDVVDSPDVWSRLRRGTWRNVPRVVNFAWWNVSEFERSVERPMLAFSVGLFDTMANSDRSAAQLRDLSAGWLAPSRRRPVRSAPLGIEVADVPVTERPWAGRVLFPGIHLFDRKDPAAWLRIVGKAHAACGATGLMRLHPAEHGRDLPGWVERTPLVDDVGERLAPADVFLATSRDESYGLAYLECLAAGVPGVFLDRPWVWEILPGDYPWVARDEAEASAMLLSLLRNGEERSWRGWVEERHDAGRWRELMGSWLAEVCGRTVTG